MKLKRNHLTASLLPVLLLGLIGAPLALGGCAPETSVNEGVNVMQTELPAIDLNPPANLATATFALG